MGLVNTTSKIINQSGIDIMYSHDAKMNAVLPTGNEVEVIQYNYPTFYSNRGDYMTAPNYNDQTSSFGLTVNHFPRNIFTITSNHETVANTLGWYRQLSLSSLSNESSHTINIGQSEMLPSDYWPFGTNCGRFHKVEDGHVQVDYRLISTQDWNMELLYKNGTYYGIIADHSNYKLTSIKNESSKTMDIKPHGGAIVALLSGATWSSAESFVYKSDMVKPHEDYSFTQLLTVHQDKVNKRYYEATIKDNPKTYLKIVNTTHACVTVELRDGTQRNVLPKSFLSFTLVKEVYTASGVPIHYLDIKTFEPIKVDGYLFELEQNASATVRMEVSLDLSDADYSDLPDLVPVNINC